MFLLVIFVIGVAIVYLLRHFFGVKYPMLKSSTIISIPALQVGLFLNTWGLPLLWINYALIYGLIEPNDLLPQLFLITAALYAVVGSFYIIVKEIQLLYALFNFNQFKSSFLKKNCARINYALVIQLVLFSIFVLIYEPYGNATDYYMPLIFDIVIGAACLFYLFSKLDLYNEKIDKLFSDEYSSSIEATIVKGIQTVIPNEIRNLRTGNPEHRATKICPYCGEEILAVAKKCRYCGEWLEDVNGVKETLVQQPAAEQPVVNHPTEEHPTEEHPAAEQPTEEHPAAEHPAEEQDTQIHSQTTTIQTDEPHVENYHDAPGENVKPTIVSIDTPQGKSTKNKSLINVSLVLMVLIPIAILVLAIINHNESSSNYDSDDSYSSDNSYSSDYSSEGDYTSNADDYTYKEESTNDAKSFLDNKTLNVYEFSCSNGDDEMPCNEILIMQFTGNSHKMSGLYAVQDDMRFSGTYETYGYEIRITISDEDYNEYVPFSKTIRGTFSEDMQTLKLYDVMDRGAIVMRIN